jgi:hypothetical protein
MPLSPRQRYAQRVLELYKQTPATPGIARRTDRCLAAALYDHRIPLETVYAALLLAAARRLRRPSDAPTLAPIATLHYFRPVIDELIAMPLDPGYLRYLRHVLASHAPALVAASPHQIP